MIKLFCLCFSKEKFVQKYLLRMNKCIDILNAGRRECPTEQLPEQGGRCVSLENYEFYGLLNSLDEKYRLILILYYVEGFKIREIAQILDMNENTVRGRLATARKKLEASYNNSRKTARTVKFEKKTAFCAAERRA